MNPFVLYAGPELGKINELLFMEVEKLDPMVQPCVRHVLEAGGKRLRPFLVLLTARAFGHDSDNAYPLACALEYLHSATLLHDDIVDGADLRRDRPAAHTLFGTTCTILAGDILLALANRMVADYDIPSLNGAMAEGIYRTAAGEIMEIGHVRNPDITFAQYLAIITGKTACLMEAACRCGAILAECGADQVARAASFGMNLGIAFQLVDDAMDYSSSRAVAGKPVGADLREGKLTLPLIEYFDGLDAARKKDIGEKFRNAELTEAEMDAIVAEVTEQGLDVKTRNLARDYLDRAAEDLAAFPDTRETTVLRDTLGYLHSREK